MKKIKKFYTLNKTIARTIITLGYLIIVSVFLYVIPSLKDLIKKDTVINIYAFADVVSLDAIREFEKEYKIKVSIKYFDTNEELFAKFKINRGKGYDLITPSDHMIDLLRKENLLAPLDHTKLPIIKELDERLLNKYFDPTNQYSLPISWVTYGIIYNKNILKKPFPEDSLDLIFKNPKHLVPEYIKKPYKVCMLEDPRELTFFAALFLFGGETKLDNNNLEQMLKVKELLTQQKNWVESYVHKDLRYFLLSEIFHVALTSSSYIRKVFETKDGDNFQYILPKEGSLLVIENFAIPKLSKNQELAHKFINFFLSRRISTLNSLILGHNPSNKTSYADIDEKFLKNPNFFPDNKVFDTLQLLPSNLPIKQLTEMWWEVKSS
ncbi:MAG: spermidine/putrescine ABC transporter substrate-binding protein [bacterium]